MRATEAVTIVHGEQELLRRTAHLFATATDVACAANDLAPHPRFQAGARARELGLVQNASSARPSAFALAVGSGPFQLRTVAPARQRSLRSLPGPGVVGQRYRRVA
ncbi:hypothetical protein [Dactylosporangium sp. CA-092794]|uniref:hypothetical protein n=1 Tax=Dactylosporangium sp. CA-092794 TaxID=3239929 RepID=UPI003D927E39